MEGSRHRKILKTKLMLEKYPLDWPLGYKRTEKKDRIYSRFKQTLDKSQKLLRSEIGLLGGNDLIISSNIPVRHNALMYSEDSLIPDPGVALYFKKGSDDVLFCCDQ